MSVLDRRVVLVTGKGGVGKTLVSTLLALRAARAGKRVLLCETFGCQRVPELFGVVSRGYTPVSLAPKLWTSSITSDQALEEYLLRVLKFRKLYELVFRNRVMGPFMDAVPGLHDLIQLGKVWDLERTRERGAPAWDLLVVDAPATGHGLTMLGSPRAMMELTVAGPFHDNAAEIARLFEDPARTAAVLVTLAEEMPVRETVDLWGRLGNARQLVGGVVLNQVHASPLPDAALYARLRARLVAQANAAGLEALADGDAELRRVATQDDARERLREMVAGRGIPVVDVPYLADLGAEGAPAPQFDALLSRVEGL